MKREYAVCYYKNKAEVIDIMNTIETMLFIAIAIFDRKYQKIKIKENEFLS